MDKRQRAIQAFLQAAGWDTAARRVLAGDASPRRYDRLTRAKPPFQAVLMDAPKDKGEDIRPFVSVARYLLETGFSAPAIYAADETLGLLLLEDLGDDLYARICIGQPRLEPLLYRRAIEVLADLQAQKTLPDVPPYDGETYLREACLLTDWYLPAATGRETGAALRDDYRALIAAACQAVEPERPCLVLRDYHAENLIWLPDRAAAGQVGLLDFQDALIGHPAYDLVSLLEDARRDTGPDLRQAMVRHFLDITGLDEAAFLQAYSTLGAQRNLKIVGIFARLWLRDGKPAYLDKIPRVWAHLMNDLKHPSLAALNDWVTRHVPAPSSTILNRIRGAGS